MYVNVYTNPELWQCPTQPECYNGDDKTFQHTVAHFIPITIPTSYMSNPYTGANWGLGCWVSEYLKTSQEKFILQFLPLSLILRWNNGKCFLNGQRSGAFLKYRIPLGNGFSRILFNPLRIFVKMSCIHLFIWPYCVDYCKTNCYMYDNLSHRSHTNKICFYMMSYICICSFIKALNEENCLQ